jgi:ribonuclease P protein component
MSNKRRLRCGFPRTRRVRRQGDFDRVYQRNVYAADSILVVQGCDNQLNISRLGLSVSRRVGNAVLRNRWKRLIREAYRLQLAEIPPGVDLVVRPRRGAEPSLVAIRASLRRLASRVERQLRRGKR